MSNQDTNITPECCGGTCTADRPQHVARPRYRVAESDDGITLDVALPGVGKDGISLSTAENILTLRADRSDVVPDEWEVHRATERPDAYELRIRLNPSLDPARIDAKLENGVLHLAVAKREEAQPRQISVH